MIGRNRTQFKKSATIVFVVLFSAIGIQTSLADTTVSIDPENPYRDFQVYSLGGEYQIRVFGELFVNVLEDNDPVVQLHRGTSIIGFNNISSGLGGSYLALDDDSGGSLPDRITMRDSLLTGTVAPGNFVIRVISFEYFGFNAAYQAFDFALRYRGFESGTQAPAAPAPALRQTSNLSFDQSQYGTDTLSDPDGQLRKTLDSINAKYGNLLK